MHHLSLVTASPIENKCIAPSCARTRSLEPVLLMNRYRAGAASCAKSVPVSDVFMPLGLALSEKQIPQITENTEK